MRHRHSVTEDPVKLAGIAAISAAVGAVVAMLFTPRNGEQVRSGLKRRASHLKGEVQDRFHTVGDEAADTVDEAKQRLQTTATKVAHDTKTTVSKAKRDAKVTGARAKTAAKTASRSRSTRS